MTQLTREYSIAAGRVTYMWSVRLQRLDTLSKISVVPVLSTVPKQKSGHRPEAHVGSVQEPRIYWLALVFATPISSTNEHRLLSRHAYPAPQHTLIEALALHGISGDGEPSGK